MKVIRKRRDYKLIDAIEEVEPTHFLGNVWRIARKGRAPTQCSRSGGRWDDGTFDVLYTSQSKDGAISEMKFHLMRGQPVIPSKVTYHLHEIDLALNQSLKLLDLNALQNIGLDTSRYGKLSYNEKGAEYPRSQDVGETAHFLDFDGLIVPSARYNCLNVVAFCDRVLPSSVLVVHDHGIVEWNDI